MCICTVLLDDIEIKYSEVLQKAAKFDKLAAQTVGIVSDWTIIVSDWTKNVSDYTIRVYSTRF